MVARENTVLRNLVRETTGCSEQQLNSYLSFVLRAIPERPVKTRARIDTSPSILLPADKKESPIAESRVEPDCGPRHNPPCSAAPSPKSRPCIGTDLRCDDSHTPHIPNDKIPVDSDGRGSTATGQDVAEPESHRSFDSGPAGVDGNQSSVFDRQQGHSMSCEEAAIIISSISIMDSAHDIREQLGCKSVGSCNVHNMEVFQVMGDAI